MQTKKQFNSNNNLNQDYNISYRRVYSESPFFEDNIGILTTLSSTVRDLEIEHPSSLKYLPLSNIRITNNSTENIAFYPNQSTVAINIPAGTIISFDKLAIGGIRSYKLTNLSATDTSANEIKISCWKEGIEVDTAFRKMHEAFFKFLFKRWINE